MNRVSEILCRLRAANYDSYNCSTNHYHKDYDIYKNMDDGRAEDITLSADDNHITLLCINPNIHGYEEKCFSCVDFMYFSYKAVKTVIFYIEHHDELLDSLDNWRNFSLVEDDWLDYKNAICLKIIENFT